MENCPFKNIYNHLSSSRCCSYVFSNNLANSSLVVTWLGVERLCFTSFQQLNVDSFTYRTFLASCRRGWPALARGTSIFMIHFAVLKKHTRGARRKLLHLVGSLGDIRLYEIAWWDRNRTQGSNVDEEPLRHKPRHKPEENRSNFTVFFHPSINSKLTTAIIRNVKEVMIISIRNRRKTSKWAIHWDVRWAWRESSFATFNTTDGTNITLSCYNSKTFQPEHREIEEGC